MSDRLVALPSQTVGPFFNFALTANRDLGVMAGNSAKGERIRLTLRLLDGEGTPVPDGIFELWQADADGVYGHPGGFGRMETDAGGVSVFETVRPGAVEGQSPHINVIVFARGLLSHLFTRIYFDSDYVLEAVPSERRETLVARRGGDGWSHDVWLQGEKETVFFDL